MERPDWIKKIRFAFQVHPVVGLLGPRQCGKTTLAMMYADLLKEEEVTRFDLENPTHLARLENPKLALQGLRGMVIIDEVQRAPHLFEVLRVLVDRQDNPARFLILGSASKDLIQHSSETLAGRVQHLELTPFSLQETGSENIDRLWLRGGYPPSFLAGNDQISASWRNAYIATFLERDIPSLGIFIPPRSLRRFWMMLAHYHGQIVNYSEIGRSFGAADTTIRRYLDILSSTFMVRQLPPWFENIRRKARVATSKGLVVRTVA
jgi:predicted AAA+ superfamily ATPase